MRLRRSGLGSFPLGFVIIALFGAVLSCGALAAATPASAPANAAVPAAPVPSATPATPMATAAPGPSVAAKPKTWTLSDVLEIAYQHNPNLKSAQANYQATHKTIMEAISGYLPRLDAVAGLSQTDLPEPSAGAASQVGTGLTYSSALLVLNQTIFDFGRVLSRINESSANADAAEQQALAVRNATKVAAESAFFNVIASEKLLDAAKRSVAQFQETYRTTNVLVQTGTRPSFDLTQANVELAKSKLGLISAQNTLDISRIALLDIMGMSEQIPFTLIEPPHPDTTRAAELDLNYMTNEALQFRPEMKSSEFSVKSARFALHSEVTHYLPTLSFQGYYGSYQPNYPVEIRTAWSAGLALTWNLFDGLNTTSRVGELSYRVDQQEDFQEGERDAIVAEVARDYKDLIRAESNLDVANDALDSAKENNRLAHQRYQASVATALELLVAESSLIDAEVAAIQAKYAREIALTALKVAVNAPLKPQ